MKTLTDAALLKIKDARKLPLVEVSWVDASSTHGWMDRDQAREEANPIECLTVGRLIRNDKETTAVAQTISEEGKFGEVWAIPAQWVKRVRRLR